MSIALPSSQVEWRGRSQGLVHALTPIKLMHIDNQQFVCVCVCVCVCACVCGYRCMRSVYVCVQGCMHDMYTSHARHMLIHTIVRELVFE